MAVRAHYQESLRRLHGGIVELATYVEGELQKALAALLRQDTALAGEILREDPEVGRRQLEVEDQCITLIATEQPVARDLRELMASMKIVSNLERIGDHAVHLAEVAIRHAGQRYLGAIRDVEEMALFAIAMLRDAMNAFRDRDSAAATAVAARDDAIDAMHDKLVQRLLNDMYENRDNIGQALSLLTVTRFLERLGDHVASMCEWTYYGIEGEHVRLK